MKTTIIPKEQEARIQPYSIIKDGKEIGDLRPSLLPDGSISWHACIRLEMTAICSNLIQGHGVSHTAAIADAIERAFKYADELRDKTTALAADVGYTIKPPSPGN